MTGIDGTDAPGHDDDLFAAGDLYGDLEEPLDEHAGGGAADGVPVDVAARLDDGLGADESVDWVLFDGDEGRLDLNQRRAFVAVVSSRFITAQSKPREWRALVANPGLIRSRLNDMFLELHIDLDREVAYKRQVAPEGERGKFPTLLYDTPYTREETVVLVYLRSRYLVEQMSGTPGRVLVDVDEIVEHSRSFRPPSHTDIAGIDAKTRKAIDNVRVAGLLVKTADEHRFEVPRAIEVVLEMETLERLLEWLRKANGSSDPPDEDRSPDSTMDDPTSQTPQEPA
ncbi:DUF4194 domain-containing protein [Kribbella sp. NPDC006257]|uniref:DUF4194 domain-containing protein n=1 Tax=Kribbella sp. NPDC006257 TaxID=3156738 RepID=UPI0033BC7298